LNEGEKMTAGRPRKPVELRRSEGNPGKRKLPDEKTVAILERAAEIPEPTRPLMRYGTELWERIWNTGAIWISDRTDIELLMMTCEMIDERWNLRIRVMQTNDAKMRRGLRELDKQIVMNLSLLGFTPTDRARLGWAEVKVQSKLEEFMARKAARG
jgi:hypothetical protein